MLQYPTEKANESQTLAIFIGNVLKCFLQDASKLPIPSTLIPLPKASAAGESFGKSIYLPIGTLGGWCQVAIGAFKERNTLNGPLAGRRK